MDLSQAIETLFSKLSVTDDMSVNDISGSFVQIHDDDLPSFTKKRKPDKLKTRKDPQSLDQSRIRCLEYLLQHLPDRPNLFNIHATDDSNKKFSRNTIEILLQFVRNMTPTDDNQKQRYHCKSHLVGLVSQSISKLLVVNIDLAYDTQLMGSSTEASDHNSSEQLGTAAKQKQFLSLCRKALIVIVGFASFELERLSQVKNDVSDPTTALSSCLAISELLSTFVRRDIRLQTDQIESIRSVALRGLLLPPNRNVDIHTMFTCATIYATLCGFESADKHANTVNTLCESLQLLVDQCYMLIPEEHDPRKLYLAHNVDTSDVTRIEVISRENRIMEFLSLINRKKALLETITENKSKFFLGAEDFQSLFKSLTHCLLRVLTTNYTFPIRVNVQQLLDLVRDAVMLDTTIHVINYKPHQKTISIASQGEEDTKVSDIHKMQVCLLRAEEFGNLIETIHYSSLKILSALILACNTHLLQYTNSISIILVQELKKWCTVNER